MSGGRRRASSTPSPRCRPRASPPARPRQPMAADVVEVPPPQAGDGRARRCSACFCSSRSSPSSSAPYPPGQRDTAVRRRRADAAALLRRGRHVPPPALRLRPQDRARPGHAAPEARTSTPARSGRSASSSDGKPYRLLGLIPMDIRLFGVDEGYVHLFGTDFTGLDIFSRTIHAPAPRSASASSASRSPSSSAQRSAGRPATSAGTLDNIVMRIDRVHPLDPDAAALAGARRAAAARLAAALRPISPSPSILSLLGWTWLARTVRSKLLATAP